MLRKFSMFVKLCLSIFLLATVVSAGNKSNDKVWQNIDDSMLKKNAPNIQTNPTEYSTFRLNKITLQTILQSAPQEAFTTGKNSEIVLTLPMPDGTFEKFAIKDSPIMHDELAAKFPEIKTYLGQGIDNPTATTRFDFTPQGFHAMILSNKGTVYINPYSKGDTENYISFNKAYAVNDDSPFCLVSGFGSEAFTKTPKIKTYDDTPNIVSNGGTLRQYRLALAATGEYTAAAGGGTVAGALAAMTTTMNRVNGIYERDLSMRMNIIANNNLIIYTNGGSDPYSNNSGFTMLGQNQSNVDSVIGNANYDIGHVFSTGGGGVASLRSPCRTGSKARGVTGLPNPTGDVFDVDFVAHEMGHQWGGNHTFNGSTSNCSGGNRNGSTAHEPGSGTTIQAYAGICSPQNTQTNSNDYFHVLSLEEMVSYSNGGGNCGANSANGNTIPTVSIVGGTTFNIPIQTPFMLTASGADANGDALTYTWEEYSLGAQSAPSATANAPMVRSYSPTTSPTRIIPSLTYILNNNNIAPTTYSGISATGAVCNFGNCLTAEFLSSIARTVPYQVTVRDNRAGGGGVRSVQATVNVINTGTPFKVTAQDSLLAPNWQINSSQTVTWDVSGTTAAPISAANVDIDLSTDGGQTFPFSLAAGTPNDGSQSITVPAGTMTTQARIRVRGTGNIFFDINNVDFNILAPTAAAASVKGRVVTSIGRGIRRAFLKLTNVDTGVAINVTTNQFGHFKFSDLQIGNSYILTVSNKRFDFPDNTQTFTLQDDLTDITFVGF